MSDNVVSNNDTLKPIFAVPDTELQDYVCPTWWVCYMKHSELCLCFVTISKSIKSQSRDRANDQLHLHVLSVKYEGVKLAQPSIVHRGQTDSVATPHALDSLAAPRRMPRRGNSQSITSRWKPTSTAISQYSQHGAVDIHTFLHNVLIWISDVDFQSPVRHFHDPFTRQNPKSA